MNPISRWFNRLTLKCAAELAINELMDENPKRYFKIGKAIVERCYPVDSEEDEIYCNVYKKMFLPGYLRQKRLEEAGII